MKQNKFHYAWIILLGAIITSGLVMGFATGGVAALFVVPITETLGIGRAAYAINMTIISLCGVVTQITIGKLYTKYRVKKFEVGAIILLALVFLARSFCNSIYQLYACSFVAGFLTAPVVMANSVMITNWFQQKRGLAISMVFAGQSVVATVISPIVGDIIANAGWQSAYRMFAVVLLVVCAPVALLVMKQNPEEKNLKPFGYDDTAVGAGKTAGRALTASCTVEEVKTKSFFILYLVAAFMAGLVGGNGAQSQLAAAHTDAFNAAAAARFVSISSLVGIGAKVLLGYFRDKFGLRRTFIAGFMCYALLFASMLFIPNMGAYYASAVFYAFVGGVGTVCFTLYASDTFGPKYFSFFFGIHQTVTFLGASVGSYLAGLIFDLTGGYTVLWIAAVLVSLATLALYMVCNTQAKKYTPKEAL